MTRWVSSTAAVFTLAVGFVGSANALTVDKISDAPTAWGAAFGSNPVSDTSTLNTPGTWVIAPKSQAGSVPSVYRSVFDNTDVAGTPDNSAYIGLKYWSVGPASYYAGVSEARMSFAIDQTSLSFLWGSVDTYNAVRFFLDGVGVGTVTNANIVPAPGNPAGRGAAYVKISGLLFDEVRFASTGNAFEFSNLTTTPVPIPAAAWLLFSGLLGLGALARRWKAPQA